jgi:hypothetical protein
MAKIDVDSKSISFAEEEEEVSWTEYLKYWNKAYKRTIGTPSGLGSKQQKQYKKMIEYSVNQWGGPFFKKMIDWVFENYQHYPQWNYISLSLVCGSHYWSGYIAQRVQLAEKNKLDEVDW